MMARLGRFRVRLSADAMYAAESDGLYVEVSGDGSGWRCGPEALSLHDSGAWYAQLRSAQVVEDQSYTTAGGEESLGSAGGGWWECAR